MTEEVKETKPAAAKKTAPVLVEDTTYYQLKDMGIKLCSVCGSKQLTNEDGGKLCPHEYDKCPML